jgi:hypothetical protein
MIITMNSIPRLQTGLEKWQARIRRLRQYLRDEPKMFVVFKKEKKMLLNKLGGLEKRSR